MATHEVTFPITDPAEILKLRAGDEVIVQGHIIGIRDRTQIRIFDQGIEPPMDLRRRVPPAHGAERPQARPGALREDLHRHDHERAHGALHGGARLAVRRPRDLRQGRLPGRGDRADAAARDGLLRDRRRRGGARDDPDRGDRGGRLGGAHARVPLEVPRQGLRAAHRRHRRPRRARSTATCRTAPRRSWRSSMPGFNDGFLGVPARPGKPRQVGLTHVIDKGLNLRDIEGLFDTAGEFVDIVKFGWGTSYVTNNLEKKISLYRSFETPVVCGGTLFEAVYAPRPARRVQALARREPLLARRDLRRDARHPARREARADRRLRPRLHRPLRGRLEGLRRRLRAVPVGAVDQGGARGRRLEGDHRGPRGRHRGDLPLRRRHAHGADRRDRPRDLGRRPALRGADEVVAGVVREALRAERQPRQHPARRGDRRRDAPPRPPRATR